jgi:hypothetical protein
MSGSVVDDVRDAWCREPDPLLDRLMERSRVLLAAEKEGLRVAAWKAKADALSALNAEQALMIEDLRGAQLAMVRRLEAAESEAMQLREKLEAIFASTSWRVSAPIRALRRFLKGQSAADPSPDGTIVEEPAISRASDDPPADNISISKASDPSLDLMHAGQVADMKEQVKLLTRQLADMRSSRSWRITAPLRAFKELARR